MRTEIQERKPQTIILYKQTCKNLQHNTRKLNVTTSHYKNCAFILQCDIYPRDVRVVWQIR